MKLVDIPVVYICPDHTPKYQARKKHMEAFLKRIGFKSVRHYKSSTVYPQCLITATIAILSDHLDEEPILVLEDDIENYKPLNEFTEVILPEDTDAFYLGFSRFGGHITQNRHDGNSSVHVKEPYIQIYNMLSAHAIIYKSKRYKERVIDEFHNQTAVYNDVILSRLHPEFNIYGYRHPFFFQSKNWGNSQKVEDSTMFHYLRNAQATTPTPQCVLQ
jgi:hypothetical protein